MASWGRISQTLGDSIDHPNTSRVKNPTLGPRGLPENEPRAAAFIAWLPIVSAMKVYSSEHLQGVIKTTVSKTNTYLTIITVKTFAASKRTLTLLFTYQWITTNNLIESLSPIGFSFLKNSTACKGISHATVSPENSNR